MKINSTLSIGKKEYKSYFVSPVGYIVIGVYLILSGWFLFSTLFFSKSVTLREFFNLMPLIMSFIVPAITMKSFSEEYKTGSYEMLGTLPLTTIDITLGKFLGSWLFVLTMLVPTLIYPISISTLGDLDWGIVLSGYIGAILLTGAFTAIGTLASTLTSNQIIAFLIGAAVCFLLTIIQGMVIILPNAIAGVVQYLSTGFHFENISRGILDSRDIIYFISVITVALMVTARRVKK